MIVTYFLCAVHARKRVIDNTMAMSLEVAGDRPLPDVLITDVGTIKGTKRGLFDDWLLESYFDDLLDELGSCSDVLAHNLAGTDQ